MAKDIHNPQAVDAYMAALDHPLKDVAEAVREAILSADANISEHIKWNAPAFFYSGEMAAFDAKEYKRDLVVFHLRKKDQVLLVFPTGATINYTTGLLEGNYTDGRRMITFKSMADFDGRKEALVQVVKQWVGLVKK